MGWLLHLQMTKKLDLQTVKKTLTGYNRICISYIWPDKWPLIWQMESAALWEVT